MRDLLLFTILLAVVITSPRRPFIGGLAWVFFGVMNPHRLTFGAAYDFPFSLVIAIVTLIGLIVSKDHRSWKGGAAGFALMAFALWNCITTVFAFNPDPSAAFLLRVLKVFAMTAVLCLLMHTKRDVIMLIATLVVSLAFYGTKGGIFVNATGGSYMVNGPPDSKMEGNNALGVGLIMVIPLMYFLQQQVKQRWLRNIVIASTVLCSISVLGAYSRGAMLGLAAMATLLWLRGRNKLVMLVATTVMVLAAIPAMPEQWFAKMNTLESYQDDNSAMFRLYAWETAYNIAKDKFPVSGGFEWEGRNASLKYSPMPTLVLVPHSIYFQVIGSQGFIGLFLYLTFWILIWRQCGALRKICRNQPDRQWAFSLASMIQVSLVGYAVGGAFLDLAFWDLPYYLFPAIVAANYAIRQNMANVKLGTATNMLPSASAPANAYQLPSGWVPQVDAADVLFKPVVTRFVNGIADVRFTQADQSQRAQAPDGIPRRP